MTIETFLTSKTFMVISFAIMVVVCIAAFIQITIPSCQIPGECEADNCKMMPNCQCDCTERDAKVIPYRCEVACEERGLNSTGNNGCECNCGTTVISICDRYGGI